MADKPALAKAASDHAQRLSLPKSAIILRRAAAVSDAQIQGMLDDCEASLRQATVIGKVVRETVPGTVAKNSFLLFETSDEPDFLPASGLVDLAHGFILLVETSKHGALVSKYAGAIDRFLPVGLERIGYQGTLELFGSEDSAYESVSLRTLGAGRGGLLRRSYEALDLKQVMPRAGTRRSAPTGVKVRRDTVSARLAPGTSRVSLLGGKAAISGLVDFVNQVAKELENPQSNSFIEGFAQPIDVGSLPANVEPSSLMVHWGELQDLLLPDNLFVDDGGELREAADADVERFRSQITADISLTAEDDDTYTATSEGAAVGTLTALKKKYSFKSDALGGFVGRVEGQDQPVSRIINTEQLFTITFSDPGYAYSNESVFRNRKLPEELQSFLSCFVRWKELGSVTSEKGKFTKNMRTFSKGSVFGVVERRVKTSGVALICDDLVDEWADHIVLDEAGQRIEFIHSKWQPTQTTSASAFHDLASQATKNLGNLTSPAGRFDKKCQDLWARRYKNDKVLTAIDRIRTRHTPKQIADLYGELVSNINTQYVMSLAASFLSKDELSAAAKKLRDGKKVKAQVVQLMWILASFIDVCRANSVTPRIYCAE